jgi:hypothetical protein
MKMSTLEGLRHVLSDSHPVYSHNGGSLGYMGCLMDPQAGEKWRNAHFTTDWRAGDPIEIEAVIGTKRYRDKGRVIKVQPPLLLQYSYWSRVSGRHRPIPLDNHDNA